MKYIINSSHIEYSVATISDYLIYLLFIVNTSLNDLEKNLPIVNVLNFFEEFTKFSLLISSSEWELIKKSDNDLYAILDVSDEISSYKQDLEASGFKIDEKNTDELKENLIGLKNSIIKYLSKEIVHS